MKRSGKLEEVSAAMEDVQQILRGSDAFQFWLFQQKWSALAGDVLAEESYIARRERDVLYIAVTNSVWMQELLMHRAKLLRRVQADPYGARFRELRIQMGPKRRAVRPASPVDRVVPLYDGRRRTAPLTDGEEAWIAQWTASHVARDEIRPAIAEMMRGALRRRKEEIAMGYHPCARCGALCPETARLCAQCEAEEDRRRQNQVVLLLKDRPELLYEDVRRVLPAVTYEDFAAGRDLLIHRYRQNHYNRCGTEEERRRLLSLLIHKPFEAITEEEARRTLSALPQKKTYGKENRHESGKRI